MTTYGSLFAGVGGFDMGFDQSGYECRFQVEWDKNCQQILQKHWPDVPKWWDVSEVKGSELPPVDVLIFGSPCQDLSVAGKRAGLSGERSVLFHQAMRIVKEMRDATGNTFPRAIVWENVAGALTSNRGADFGVVLDEMAKAGALVIEWALLDAQYFGVPQRRRRIFLVALLDPSAASRCPNPLLPVAEGVRRDSAKSGKKKQKAAGETPISFGRNSFAGWEETEIAITLAARDFKGGTVAVVDSLPSKQDKPGPTAYSIREDAKANNFSATELDYANSLSALIPSPQSHHAQMFIVDESPMSFDTQFGSNANVFQDMSPTLKSSQQQPSILQSDQDAQTVLVRRLTPIECERLMGWPDEHTRWRADGKEQTGTSRLRQCGNGVATPVARWVAKNLHPVLAN